MHVQGCLGSNWKIQDGCHKIRNINQTEPMLKNMNSRCTEFEPNSVRNEIKMNYFNLKKKTFIKITNVNRFFYFRMRSGPNLYQYTVEVSKESSNNSDLFTSTYMDKCLRQMSGDRSINHSIPLHFVGDTNNDDHG